MRALLSPTFSSLIHYSFLLARMPPSWVLSPKSTHTRSKRWLVSSRRYAFSRQWVGADMMECACVVLENSSWSRWTPTDCNVCLVWSCSLRPKITVVIASWEITLTKYILKNINIYSLRPRIDDVMGCV
jgi:hypothetical protein